MGKVKAVWQAEQERLTGIGSDGVFSDYVSEEVWHMREETNKLLKSEVVRDEWDLWATHDGQGDY